MARGSNSRDGRTARSELPKLRISGGVSMEDTSVGDRFMGEYNVLGNKTLARDGISKGNLSKIAGMLNEIKQKVLPTNEIGLLDLTERERDRYLAVRNDESVGYYRSFNTESNQKLQADFKKVREDVQAKAGEEVPYNLADQIVVNQANDYLQASYLGGKRDFALRASYFFDAMTKKYGQNTATRLTEASLREAFHRMARAGMIYQEKDPRFNG